MSNHGCGYSIECPYAILQVAIINVGFPAVPWLAQYCGKSIERFLWMTK